MCIEKWCYRLLLPSDDMIWTDIADRVWHHKKHISLNLKTRQTLWTVSVCPIMETNESNMYIPSETKILCLVFQYTYYLLHPSIYIIPNNNINIYVRKLHFQPYWNTIWLNVIPGIEGDRLIGSIATLPMCKQVSFLD